LARGGSRAEQERRARKAHRADARREEREVALDPDHPKRVAFHEAGHAVVAHAVGLTTTYIRVGWVVLPPGHPDNPTKEPLDSGGFHRIAPNLAAEVQAKLDGGEALTAAEREWALQHFVVCFAGPIAESAVAAVSRDETFRGARGDFQQATWMAEALGRAVDMGEGKLAAEPGLWQAGQEVAQAILLDRAADMALLADLLESRAPCEAGEETLAVIFERFEQPAGSHRHLLDRLALG
jgi:hypothetical protein